MKKVLTNAYKLAYLAPLALATQVHAAPSIEFPASFADFSTQDVKTTIQNIVRIIVGFLGIIVIIIILAGGFKWLTSGGNEEKIGEAKKIITAGIIGLVIIFTSYAIATFVITQLIQATGAV